MSKPSKIEVAKTEQYFQMKPQHPRCADCQHFTMQIERYRGHFDPETIYERHSNLRCGLGGFKVGKQSVCARFERKITEST